MNRYFPEDIHWLFHVNVHYYPKKEDPAFRYINVFIQCPDFHILGILGTYWIPQGAAHGFEYESDNTYTSLV